ncbi:MAG: DNA mismatch repair protein MutS [Clostridia bacterium]|nr:DNA mismatch repair protein MutS [Clostridia bacterium]
MADKDFSPMMKLYLETKEEYPDCILFYRLGDFYEMFFEDAKTVSRELELTLTGKACGQEERAPMCGVPHHSASTYIERLVSKGYKVAVCEQVEDPKTAKGIVKREVVRVVTRGTVSDDNMLSGSENNYLAVCTLKEDFGLCFCDISTGEIYLTNAKNKSDALAELARYMPRELLLSKDSSEALMGDIKHMPYISHETFQNSYFEDQMAKKHFGDSINSYNQSAILALTGIIKYLVRTQKNTLEFLKDITYYSKKEYMEIDAQSRRSLEICETMRDRSQKGSLLGVLDKTRTAMGARCLRQWVEKPLLNASDIERRLFAVDELTKNPMMLSELRHTLEGIYDISRIVSRVLLRSVTPKDMAALRESLKMLPSLKLLLKSGQSQLLKYYYQELDTMTDLGYLLKSGIAENPPMTVKDGGVIKEGFDSELDKLRSLRENAHLYITSSEERERERTGIKNLKIRYNKVFGYYIEVTKLNENLVPDNYIRKQTLVNSERYITPELKELEEKILSASENIYATEVRLFEHLRNETEICSPRLKQVCAIVSIVDTLCSLAEVALKNNYTMPEISTSGEIIIKDGRHPVVERAQREVVFVPNDTYLDKDDNRLLIITGPNMAGKSTYMRQTALITLMAQIGSFVPAKSAKIGICDRIFTRVGASDDIAQGQSTFMLEMTEVANILENASRDSLLILDEIGRGTSTFDGLSIAWAVCEYVANKKKIGAKTLFATHYHELCSLEGTVDGVKNYSIAVKKRGDDITFLRKIVPGGTDDSFGIEVAALAGVPKAVVSRAKEILKEVEAGRVTVPEKTMTEPEMQLGFADLLGQDILEELRNIDATVLTPIEALNKLYELSNKAKFE